MAQMLQLALNISKWNELRHIKTLVKGNRKLSEKSEPLLLDANPIGNLKIEK